METRPKTLLAAHLELHSAVRRPTLTFKLNGQELSMHERMVEQVSKYQTNVIFETLVDLNDTNLLEIVMTDKTKNDILLVEGQYVDHWFKIKELELDKSKIDPASHLSGSIYMISEPEETLEEIRKSGFAIERIYHNASDIRFNGTWAMLL